MGERVYPKNFDIIGISVYAGFVLLTFTYAVYNLGLKKWWRRWRGGDPVFKGAVRWAAAAGDLKALDALSLSPDFDVDSPIEGFTALHAAVIGGHRDAVLWLCQRGANVNATKTDGWGDTALHYAAARGDSATARVLLAYGAHPRAKNSFATTPAEQARKRRHTELAEYLVNCANGKVQLPVPRELENWEALGSSKGSSKEISTTSSDDGNNLETGNVKIPTPKLTPEQQAACRAAAARSYDGIGSEGTMVKPYTYLFRLFSFCMLATSMAYLFWRGARSLVPYPIGNYLYCIFVYVVELSFLPLTFVFVLSMWNTIDRSARWAGDMLPKHKLPHVDVYVVRYSEEVDILEPTVIAALNMNWPGDKLTVHVLDDGSGKDVLKMVRRLRYQLTCMKREARLVYVAHRRLRSVPHHSKAGNINHAILGSQGKGEYIMVLDTDMIVHPDFLQRTIGHFYKRGPGGQGWVQKPRTAFLQTPQDFWNVPPSDPMVHCARFFYGPMLQGRDGLGTAPCCGTGVVFSRTALVSIGGQSYGSITEDYNTSMTLFTAGFSSMFLNERLVYGMAPEDLVEVFQQRRRWAMGALQILFQDNPLCKSGLTISQSLMFFEAAAYHFLAIPTIILTIVPFLFVFLELAPVVAFSFWEFAAGFGTFFVLNRLAMYTVSRGINGADNELWRGWQMWIWMAPNHLKSIITVLMSEISILRWLTRKKEITFKVTNKASTMKRPNAPVVAEDNAGGFWKTLGVTWYFLLYYVVYVAALAYAIITALTDVQLWTFAMDIASLGWALLNCLCIWPPVCTLLPRQETAQGWRIQWQALFSLGTATSSSTIHQIGRTSAVPRLSMSSPNTPTRGRRHHDENYPFEAVDAAALAAAKSSGLYNPTPLSSGGSMYPYASGNLTEQGHAPARRGSMSQQLSIPRHGSTNVGRVAAPLRTAASLQASALFTGAILPEREGHTTQASRQPSMLAVAPSGELGPAPAGVLPMFSLQHASLSDGFYHALETMPSWTRQNHHPPQPQEPPEFIKEASLWPKNNRSRPERQIPSWLKAPINEDASLRSRFTHSSAPVNAPPRRATSAATDGLVNAAAAKLVTIAEMEEGTEPSAPPTFGPNSAEPEEDELEDDSVPFDERTEEELAALVALTGDSMAWAHVMATGRTYHRADAGTLLEDLGSMADHDGHVHSHELGYIASPAESGLDRSSLSRHSPFLAAIHPMPLVPARLRAAPPTGLQNSAFNDSSIRVGSSLGDSIILQEPEALEADLTSPFTAAPQPDPTMTQRGPSLTRKHSSVEAAIAMVSRLFHPFAAAAQEDAHESSQPPPGSNPAAPGINASLFEPFAAGKQVDEDPWMDSRHSYPDKDAKGPTAQSFKGTLTPGSRESPRTLFDGYSPFLTGTMPSGPEPFTDAAVGYVPQESSIYPSSDRLESTYDASLILPEPMGLESSFFSAFAPASKVHFEEPTSPRGSGYSYKRTSLALQTAPSAAQERVLAVSHHLLDIAATMTPNASAALRSSSVLVVPVMPASVFEHSIGSKPCFEASPPSPSNIAYVLISIILMLGLIGSSIAEHYLTIP